MAVVISCVAAGKGNSTTESEVSVRIVEEDLPGCPCTESSRQFTVKIPGYVHTKYFRGIHRKIFVGPVGRLDRRYIEEHSRIHMGPTMFGHNLRQFAQSRARARALRMCENQQGRPHVKRPWDSSRPCGRCNR